MISASDARFITSVSEEKAKSDAEVKLEPLLRHLDEVIKESCGRYYNHVILTCCPDGAWKDLKNVVVRNVFVEIMRKHGYTVEVTVPAYLDVTIKIQW